MADKSFRVLLDLTELHIESFKYVWVNVLPQELKTISDFKASILSKIKLIKADIKLFVQNGLLLDDETVTILREDDTVKVQYESQYYSANNHSEISVKERKSSRKRNHSGNYDAISSNAKRCKSGDTIFIEEKEEIDLDDCKKKKKKRNKSPIYTESSLNQSVPSAANNFNVMEVNTKKDGKQKTLLERNTTDYNLTKENDWFFSFNIQDDLREVNESNTLKTEATMKSMGSSRHLKLDSMEDSLAVNDLSVEHEKILSESLNLTENSINKPESSNCPKKKRKRRKKCKKVLETVTIDVHDNNDVKSEFKSFINVDESIQRKHIIYPSSPDEEQDMIKSDGNKNEKGKHFISDTFTLDASVSNKAVKIPHNHPKISTPTQSNFNEKPNWCLSLMQKTTSNSHNIETAEHKKDKSFVHTKVLNEQSIAGESHKSSEKPPHLKYADLPSLNSRPDIGTHIAYKIVELDVHYSPVVSDYREGVVKSIDLETEEMEIELLKHEIKPGRTGKFENLKEGEIPPPEIKTCETVKWSSLLEPKLLDH